MSREPSAQQTTRKTVWGTPSLTIAARRSRQSYEPDCASFRQCLRIDDTDPPAPNVDARAPANPASKNNTIPLYPLSVQSERLHRIQDNSKQLL
eukprot:scaffold196230_cov33-Attheya_sp.AAC.1